MTLSAFLRVSTVKLSVVYYCMIFMRIYNYSYTTLCLTHSKAIFTITVVKLLEVERAHKLLNCIQKHIVKSQNNFLFLFKIHYSE